MNLVEETVKSLSEGLTVAERKLQDIIKIVGDYDLEDVVCETSPGGNVHIMTRNGKDICTVGREEFAINGNDEELIDELRENGYWKESYEESKQLKESVDSDYFKKFKNVMEKYLPSSGEGETLASQIVTAINKLVYKWYNDGDVYDNVNSGLQGWANDLTCYANWLYKYCDKTHKMLDSIYDCNTEDEYEDILKSLADECLDLDYLVTLEKPKQGSIYDCNGPFEFSEKYDDEGEYDYEEEEDLDESKLTEVQDSLEEQDIVIPISVAKNLTDVEIEELISRYPRSGKLTQNVPDEYVGEEFYNVIQTVINDMLKSNNIGLDGNINITKLFDTCIDYFNYVDETDYDEDDNQLGEADSLEEYIRKNNIVLFESKKKLNLTR